MESFCPGVSGTAFLLSTEVDYTTLNANLLSEEGKTILSMKEGGRGMAERNFYARLLLFLGVDCYPGRCFHCMRRLYSSGVGRYSIPAGNNSGVNFVCKKCFEDLTADELIVYVNDFMDRTRTLAFSQKIYKIHGHPFFEEADVISQAVKFLKGELPKKPFENSFFDRQLGSKFAPK